MLFYIRIESISINAFNMFSFLHFCFTFPFIFGIFQNCYVNSLWHSVLIYICRARCFSLIIHLQTYTYNLICGNMYCCSGNNNFNEMKPPNIFRWILVLEAFAMCTIVYALIFFAFVSPFLTNVQMNWFLWFTNGANVGGNSFFRNGNCGWAFHFLFILPFPFYLSFIRPFFFFFFFFFFSTYFCAVIIWWNYQWHKC